MRVARCNARARGTARDADSSDLRESGVKSGPRGAWPSSRGAPSAAADIPPVQLFPSEQGVALLVWAQPVAELQVSSVHTFPSSQLGDAPPTHLPPPHLSLVVQAFPSLHRAVLFVSKQ